MAFISFKLVMVVGIIMGVYSLLAIGMNMHWGDTGLLNFAHAGFFAVGAYTSAILTTPVADSGLLANRVVGFGFPIVVGMVAATVTAALAGILLGITSVRLEGDYLAIVTLAGAETLRLIIAGTAGIMLGLDANLRPNTGFVFLIPVFAAVILGGIDDPVGTVVGGYILGIGTEVSVAVIPSEYKPAFALLLLVIGLLSRPDGLFGEATR
jgi:ABC-type branched-subunit amino acid transport system permease subunit